MENILSDYAGFDCLNVLPKVKIKTKKWRVKLPNGDIEEFNNKRDAECFASVMRCFILDFPYENIKTKSSSGLQRSRLRSDK